MAFDYRREYSRYQKYFLALRRLYDERPDVRAYLGILLSLVAVSFFIVFALQPTLTTIASLFSQIKTQQEVLAKLEEKSASLEQAQNTYLAMQDRLLEVRMAIPQSPQPALFLRQLEVLAVRNNVSILTVSVEEVTLFGGPGKTPKTATAQKLPAGAADLTFSISLTGSYPALSQFLANLSQLRRPILFENVVFASQAASGNITMAITGTVPFQQEE